jgi:16S rRNA (guanine1516-N2)-methyltransferase
VICTTPTKDSTQARQRAIAVGEWFDCPFVVRNQRTLQRLFTEEKVGTVIVADRQPKLYSTDDLLHPLFFHPGMAQQRLIRMRKGEADRLVSVSGLSPGDVVVDATFGLGIDSLVLAAAVGVTGKVIGLESSLCLARLFTFAQATVPTPYPMVDPLLNRIQVRIGCHTNVLKEMGDNSVDVVYFDPMFRQAPKSDSGLDVARPWANPTALDDEAWLHAQRVARRSVVLKERLGSGQFERFGVEPDKRTQKFAFGVWRKEAPDGVYTPSFRG